ncbi:MAG: SDR family NAD(P)-dependent oxidoreductase [Actinomycetota bacterium]
MPAPGSALVTGANRGIGRAVALELARRGCPVVATVRDPATAGPLLDAAAAEGLPVTVAPLDLEAVTPLDLPDDLRVVVNNAGLQTGYLPVEAVPLDAVRALVETNYVGQIAVLQQVIPVLRRRGEGVICTVTSAAVLLASPFYAAYRASKAALHALVETLAVELAPFGIRVLEVMPGPVATDGLARSEYLPAVELPAYRAVAERMMAGRDATRSLAVTPEAAAARIVDTVLDDDAPMRTACDPVGDDLLAAWRSTTDAERLARDLARYRPGVDA